MWSSCQDQSQPVANPDSSSTQLLRTGQSYLERLGVLYHAQIRLAIVTELHMREMSPKQFYTQVGGTSYDSVRRHFLKLAEHGWLRMVRSDRSRRGRPEHLYRSTELPIIDDETWAEIPRSIRDAFTVKLMDEMADWVAKSQVSKTFQSRADSALSFRSGNLDEVGWAKAIAALNACFRSLSQEQMDAKVRLERSGAPPIPMVVELGGFEIPSSLKASMDLPFGLPAADAPPWPPRIAKVFSDPLSLAIIKLLNESPMSPRQLRSVLGGASVEGFNRRCKNLTRLGWVAKVASLTGGARRGARENFYRATYPTINEIEILGRVPEAERGSEPWRQFQIFFDEALGAIKAGTFNARADRHLSLYRLSVDDMAWSQVIIALRRCERSLARIEHEAESRSHQGGGQIRKAGFLVAGFAGPGALEAYRQHD